MKILGIDTSAKTSSVGICDDDKIVGELFLDKGLTHSETILPMIDEILTRNGLTLDDIDALAVNNGPGSFTGIRIGVAVVKGLAFEKNIPCYEVSTLDSIAYNCKDKNGLVVAVMDARRNQVYNANYIVSDGKAEKVIKDRSILIKDLYLEISEYDGDVFVIGDGQDKVKEFFEENNMTQDNFYFPDYYDNLQKGINTALIAYDCLENKKCGEEILPLYLKLSQAEQELRKKRG
ncbi:MAG: tRNA (adenosine(37)-N6)-threonylcarbamoyltransferase complex dimerization subunit type 1 TsaB [Oscillospiraceae bacterium]|nr:tRNA (adenosine(37)-N6)-threonylcarbamoyltransferase complex dimerization subunit type 1 TsaB [Oscillospiraceae bacterium]